MNTSHHFGYCVIEDFPFSLLSLFTPFVAKRPFLGKWVPFDKARASLYLKKCLFPSKSGTDTHFFYWKCPPKWRPQKCAGFGFFSGWEMATIIISGTWWRLSTDMRYFLSFHISVPFGAHFLLKHLHVKGKNGQRFRLVICSRPLFQPFSEEKRAGNLSSWTQKYYFLFLLQKWRFSGFFFSIMNQHVILFTRNVVQYSLKSISRENICYGPRTEHDTKANRMRQFFLL